MPVKRIFLAVGLMLCMLTTACAPAQERQTQSVSTSNPTASDLLESNPGASLFMYQGTVYMAGVDWVDELELTRGEPAAEVLRQSANGEGFENGMANKLEKGTILYEAAERSDVLIADTPEDEIRFYGMVEG
ncbi:hypothetical protein QWJ34_22230 [Saccharibacillus sp. CPCC 101409]|uniref:hypothetical protein n=1 Tax=Saccharibacillus sp. CPCC 101409 TaxID=3058041 RepID=UPI002670E8CF|nr:hypothetical protein [Saccharibacillus sp. CPCC 101409]MDO3412499.1 hypothetical protein [Saccharibacillus sp. CPCC 101409]